MKAEKHLNEREIEICALRDNLERIRSNFNNDQTRTLSLEDKIDEYKAKLYKYEQDLYNKDKIITNMAQEKDTVISTISKELVEERAAREKYQKELEAKATILYELRRKLEEVRNENADMITIPKRDTCKLFKELIIFKNILCQNAQLVSRCLICGFPVQVTTAPATPVPLMLARLHDGRSVV